MKYFKHVCVSIILSLIFFSGCFAADIPKDFIYADTPYKEAVGILTSCRIIEPNKVETDKQLTRAEMARIGAVLLEEWRFQPEKYNSAAQFTDVPANHPAFAHISYCVDNRLMLGNGSTFSPNGYVSFNDFCVMLLKVLGMESNGNAITTAQNIDLFHGLTKTPQPDEFINRQTALPIVVNTMYAYSPRLHAQNHSAGMTTIAACNFFAAERPALFNVVYVPNSDIAKHTLDVYYPQGAAPVAGWPVIISMHGGGFTRGDKFGNKLNTVSFEGLKNGYAVVGVSYRLADTAKVPAQIVDTKAAVRFLRQNATKLGLNANKFVIVGYSSGANLAALVATSPNNHAFENELQHLGITTGSDEVAAAVAFYGHYDQLTRYTQYAWLTGEENAEYDIKYAAYKNQRMAFNAAYDLPYKNDPDWVSPVFSKPLLQAVDLVKLMNPATFAAQTNTPLLLLHGEMDSTVNFLQSVDLAEALKASHADIKLVLVPHAEHGVDFHAVYGMDAVFEWLDKKLNK